MDKIYDIITRTIKEENILRDELLSKHTTFRIGGKADYFVKPASENEVAVLVKELNENNIDFYIMGNGSNILATFDSIAPAPALIVDSSNNSISERFSPM